MLFRSVGMSGLNLALLLPLLPAIMKDAICYHRVLRKLLAFRLCFLLSNSLVLLAGACQAIKFVGREIGGAEMSELSSV